jgi:hypothetical protein
MDHNTRGNDTETEVDSEDDTMVDKNGENEKGEKQNKNTHKRKNPKDQQNALASGTKRTVEKKSILVKEVDEVVNEVVEDCVFENTPAMSSKQP